MTAVPHERPAAERLLRDLLGTWRGTGRGTYPTIDDFAYREVLAVTTTPAEGLLHYVQQTWKKVGDTEAPSHLETGFISVTDDGEVEVHNAQGRDRVEVLRGRIEPGSGSEWTLALAGVVHGGDPRMRRASRRLTVAGAELHYTMEMATDRVADSRPHLTARLTRSSVPEGGASGTRHRPDGADAVPPSA